MNHPLPRGWREFQIKDICSINYGKGLGKNNIVEGNIPVYSSGGIIGYHNESLINSKGVIIGRKGNAGSVFYSNSPFFCIDTAFYVEANDNIDLKFLYYKLTSIKLERHKIDSAVPGINRDTIYSISITIPPIDEQKRIAEVLSLCDKLIENLTKLIEKKEIYKKGVMQRVLTGKVRFNGFKDEWREINLRDIVEEYSIPNTNKLKQYTIGKNGIKELDDFRHSIDKHKVFKKNDLIVGIGIDEINVNINLDYGCCSPVYRVYSINTNLLNPKFGYFYIRKAIDRIKNKITRKSTRREFEFDHKEFIKYSILLPSLEEQNKIAELLTLIDKDIEILKQLLHLRKLQKKGLMQKLLTGEVRL